MQLKLRWYQEEAELAIIDAWKRGVRRPLVCLPTGSGKSAVISSLNIKFRHWYPKQNIITTVHTKELVGQLAATYESMSGEAPGIYSASLRKKDPRKVTYAQIQSIFKKEFKNNIGLVSVDECDRVPVEGDGQYRTFLSGIIAASSHCRFAGFTATPYRLGCGLVYGPGLPWEEMVYDADVRKLIDQGFLCNLVSKNGGKPNLLGVRKTGGDYNAEDLDEILSENSVLDRAIHEILKERATRKAAIYFSPGLKHAKLFQEKLYTQGIRAEVIHSSMPSADRDSYIAQFKAGIINDLININILTIGFDAPHLDMIVMLRPTTSAGLYYQMIGRGLRICEGKSECLILDLAGNIEWHGPIDTLNKRITAKKKDPDAVPGEAPQKQCPECEEFVYASARTCPHCDFVFPEREIPHSGTATELSPLSGTIVGKVTDVTYLLHPGKDGKPQTIKVTYKVRSLPDVNVWLSCDSSSHPFAKSKWVWWLSAQRLCAPSATFSTAREWLPWLRRSVLMPSEVSFKNDESKYLDVIGFKHGD